MHWKHGICQSTVALLWFLLARKAPYNPHVPLWHLFPLDLFKPPLFSIRSDGPNSPQTQSRILSSDIRSVKLSLVSATIVNQLKTDD